MTPSWTSSGRGAGRLHTSAADRGGFSVKVSDAAGALAGGLSAWTWGGLCGCDRVAVSSFTFQAPGFYERHGYAATGRALGVPGDHADVQLFKQPTG